MQCFLANAVRVANTFGKGTETRWSGTQLATENALSNLLKQSGLGIDDIDHVNSAANGTIACDAAEARAIATVLKDVPTVSYKGAIGDSMSGSGLIECPFITTIHFDRFELVY